LKPQAGVILGGPGLGKSTTAGSIAEVVGAEQTLLMVAKPGEEDSFIYQKYGLTDRAELYYDLDWNPEFDEYKANAYMRLLQRLKDLREDTEYDAVIIDPGTDVVTLIEHYLLSPSNVGSPGELDEHYRTAYQNS